MIRDFEIPACAGMTGQKAGRVIFKEQKKETAPLEMQSQKVNYGKNYNKEVLVGTNFTIQM